MNNDQHKTEIESHAAEMGRLLDELLTAQSGVEGIGELIVKGDGDLTGYAVISAAKHIQDLLNRLDGQVFHLLKKQGIEGFKSINIIEPSPKTQEAAL
jgi:hypothetical protein